MAKFRDIRTVGRSSICPYIAGESADERHARRKATAESSEQSLREWCFEQGLTLAVKNEGHHWIITGTGIRIEWWPSSAKVVAGERQNRFRKGVHCHDIDQLKGIITKLLDQGARTNV